MAEGVEKPLFFEKNENDGGFPLDVVVVVVEAEVLGAVVFDENGVVVFPKPGVDPKVAAGVAVVVVVVVVEFDTFNPVLLFDVKELLPKLIVG